MYTFQILFVLQAFLRATQFINTTRCTHYWYSWIVISNSSRAPTFKVPMEICKAIKSSAIFGSAGSGKRELCSPYDYLNPKQFDRLSGRVG